MSNLKLIAEGVNVSNLLWALQKNPELWDADNQRTKDVDSPHYELSDIFVRYAADDADTSKDYKSVWYGCADLLPIKEMVFDLMKYVGGTRLGGVLITKIPAGKECKPHIDQGWHARFYEKYAIQVQSAPGQEFYVQDEKLETRPGDVFWFDNSYLHWVTNPTQYDRITVIVCINKE